MYPSDDALIGPGPSVTALKAGIQLSHPITWQESKMLDTAPTVAAPDYPSAASESPRGESRCQCLASYLSKIVISF